MAGVLGDFSLERMILNNSAMVNGVGSTLTDVFGSGHGYSLKPPSWLNSGAKKAFNYIVQTYADTSFLNDADLYILARYCDLWSEYRACNTRLKKNGRSEGGKTSGDLRFKLNLSAEMDKMEKEMGLTPAARASLAIHAQTPDSESETDEFDEDFDNEVSRMKAVK